MKKIALKKYFFTLFLLPLAAALFVACSDNDNDHITIMVAAEKAECGTPFGAGPNCLYMKGDVYEEWITIPAYYIAGFEHDEGYEYELEVEKIPYETINNSSIGSEISLAIQPPHVYRLVRIISKVEVEK